ncbi:MAG: hypothetical protein QOH71_1731 [Blastocatellia bacterium]|jgi:hypothetical protein|nr:hypothetical protein [Blastocatellia bacterium]
MTTPTTPRAEIDIFRELRKLDDRVQQVSQLLDASARLFEDHYSESFRDYKGNFSWPYGIGPIEPIWPDYPEFKTSRIVSPLTNALCGWSIGNHLQPTVGTPPKLREVTAEIADKLAGLPSERLRSSTFQADDEVFLHAQVLRFLAWRSRWKGDMFAFVFDRVHQIATKPNSSLHPFFLYYCILALEEVRMPTANIADTVLELCRISEKVQRAKVTNSFSSILELFRVATALANAVEKLATLVDVNFRMPDVASELKKFTAASALCVDEIAAVIRTIRKGGRRPTIPSLEPIVEACINQAGIILDALPKQIIQITPVEERNGWKLVPETTEQVLRTVAERMRTKFVWYSDDLRQQLHTQILSQVSYAASADGSRLDIGALAYSLAGALRIGAINVTHPLARKALALIFEHQKLGRWRDVQPMSRSKQGFVHVPSNLEIANALLGILVRNPPLAVDVSLKQIDEVMDWVAGTVNTVGDYQGWCNEQDYSPQRIDFWVTAQVVQFLVNYRETRIRLTTRWALEQAGLVTVPSNAVPTRWDDLSPTDPEKPYVEQVKNKLKDKLALPFERTKTLTASSVLLFGPPGTSKTSLMEALANRLRWEFLQISPADFLSAGGDQVEARASLIFEILKRAKNLVVLFDEVDEFLIDREASGRMEGIFRFMTTSMLPKLQSLRSKRTLIFGIATNYKERLDKAITRLGRVDYDWPVLPPDFTSRLILVNIFDRDLTDNEARDLAANTPFFSYLELKRVVRERTTLGTLDPWTIVRHPTASPEAYGNRPRSEEEFELLLTTQITDSVFQGASDETKKRVTTQLRELHERPTGEAVFEKAMDDKIVAIADDLEAGGSTRKAK